MLALKEKYQKIVPDLKKELDLSNSLALPKIEKVIVHAGFGKQKEDKHRIEVVLDRLAKITGQKPAPRAAKKSIATYKLREGQNIGAMVTLRGERMWGFLDKLINVALARTRDFRGISRSGFDGKGNYSLGLREQLVFPEMAQEEIVHSFGMQVTLTTNARNDENAYLLLKKLGFPFKD